MDAYHAALEEVRKAGVPWGVILAMLEEGLWPDEVDLSRWIRPT